MSAQHTPGPWEAEKDEDPDSLYVPKRDCLCSACRDELEEPSEFEADALGCGGMK